MEEYVFSCDQCGKQHESLGNNLVLVRYKSVCAEHISGMYHLKRFSQKIILSMDKVMRSRLKAASKAKGITMSAYIRSALDDKLDAEARR